MNKVPLGTALRVCMCAGLFQLFAPTAAQATGVPVDGFLPQVGITLTNEYIDELDFFPAPSSQPGGIFLGPTSAPVYDIALLDTGAATSLLTTAADTAFNIGGSYPGDNDGFRGTEVITIGGASGFVDASINDPLGLYAAGLQSRTTNSGALAINNSSFEGQTNTSNITVPAESDLPNVVGLSFASQYATRIRNSQPQIFEVDGQTVRSPAIDFHPLGSEGLGITRKAQLFLAGPSPSTPLHFPNLGNLDLDRPWENPSQPTVVQGGHFLNATFNNNSASLSSEFFFDTGASVTVLSEFKALEMGFDVTTDEPEFTISIIGSGGLIDVPGFFVDQITVPALGGNLVVNNVPVIVLDVTNVSNPGNVVDGIIGTNIFQGRDIVIDPNPSLGGGGPSAGVYISDPVTTEHNWSSTAATGNWQTTSSWSPASVPGQLSNANVRHVAGGNQQVTLASDSQVFEVNISGGSGGQTMTLAVTSGAKLTTFSGTNIEEGGVLQLEGATLDTQYIDVREGGVLTGEGSIFTGSGTIGGQVENVAGLIAPGDGIGTLEIEGRLSNSTGGTLQFDLGGLAPGTEHDHLDVDGTVALAGTLEVILDGSFTPSVNDTFTLISVSESLAGEFEHLLLPTGYNWGVNYNATSLELFVGDPGDQLLFGDANNDLAVDGSDLLAVTNNFASTGPTNGLLLGDANDDGVVEGGDLLAVTNNFGSTLPGSLGSTSFPEPVPEPATGLVLALMLGGSGLAKNSRLLRR